MDLSQICSISDPAILSQMLIVPPDHCYWNRHYDSYRLSGHIWCITRKFKEKKCLGIDKKNQYQKLHIIYHSIVFFVNTSGLIYAN